MKHILTALLLLSFSFSSKCQLTKGIWLVGGTGSFFSTTNTYSSPNYSQSSDVIDLKISPNIDIL